MSKKKYLKPEVGIIKFNNGDSNMLDPTYLYSAANYNANSLKYSSDKNSVKLHS